MAEDCTIGRLMDEPRSIRSTVSSAVDPSGGSATAEVGARLPSGAEGSRVAAGVPLGSLAALAAAPARSISEPAAPAPDAAAATPTPVQWPGKAAIVDEMLELARVEAEAALLASEREAGADLAARAVLLAWDRVGVAPVPRPVAGAEGSAALDPGAWADRHLFGPAAHPLSSRLQITAALIGSLGRGDAEQVLAWAERGLHHADPGHRGELALWLAEAWHFGGGKVPSSVLDHMVAGESPHARALAQLLGCAPRRVAELAAAAVGRHGGGDLRAEAASWLLDSGGEPHEAATLCARAPSSDLATRLRCLELAIEARLRGDGGEPLSSLWLERAQLVGELSNGALDAAVSRVLAAEADERGREPGRDQGREPGPTRAPSEPNLRAVRSTRSPRGTGALDAASGRGARHLELTILAEVPAVRDPHFGPLYLHMRGLTYAIAAGDRAAAIELRRRLAFESPCPVAAACHAARAATALEAGLGDAGAGEPVRDLRGVMLELAEIAAERLPGASLQALRARAHLRGSLVPAQAVDELAALDGAGMRWAAHLAERRVLDAERAQRLWGALAAAEAGRRELSLTLEHLAASHRRTAALEALAHDYAALADREDSARAAAVWRCAAAALALLTDSAAAQALLGRAAEAAPRDPVSRVGLLRLACEAGAWSQAARLLDELGHRLGDPRLRRRYARERAILLGKHLARPDDAEAVFEQILAEDPLDAETLVALGELYERRHKPMLAIAARRRAGDLLPTRAARVQQLVLVGELCRKHSELEDGLSALEQARRLDPEHADVQRLLADLYEQLGKSEHAVLALRTELARNPEPARRVAAQLKLAGLLSRIGNEPEAVVAAYLDVLSVEPDNAEALEGILQPARALGWWHALTRAFRAAPPTERHLEILADALEHMASYGELARVRRSQLEAAVELSERARRAFALAMLYDTHLADTAAAVVTMRQAVTLAADEERATYRRQLEALFERRERWADLAELVDAEQRLCDPGSLQDRARLLVRLARLRCERLDDAAGGVRACEEALALVPDHPDATALLDAYYERAGRIPEAITAVERRAERGSPRERSTLLARAARLYLASDELERALSAYQAAIEADPADRDTFTGHERLCYLHKRWPEVLRLYDTAIAHVEAGAPRAYRLYDLYTRKAQVQAQFAADPEGAIDSLTRLVVREKSPEAALVQLEELCQARGDYLPLVRALEQRGQAAREGARAADAYRRAVRTAEIHLVDAELVARLRLRVLELDPSDDATAAALEAHYRERKDVTAILEMLRGQVAGSRDSARSIELLGRIAEISEQEARDVDGAIYHYSRILDLEPDHPESLEALGRIYESTERWTELIEVTRRQIRGTTDPSSKALLYFRCGSVMEAKFGRQEDAIRYYQAAIKASTACMPAIHGLRDLYRRRQEWPRVIETLELELKLWQDDKERAGVLAQIGQVYAERIGDVRSARQYFQEALTVDPDCAPANWALFEAYFAAGNWDQARPLANALTLKAMRDGEPATRSEFYRKRGVVSLRTGDPRAAADSFVVALEIRPTNLEALEALGAVARSHPEAYEFESTYRELEKVYRRRDDAAPHLARVWIGLAVLAERAGDLDTGAELAAAATALAPADLTVLLAVVDFHCDMRRWQAAVEAIEAFLPNATSASRTAALLRQAEIHADGQLDGPRAMSVLGELLAGDPACHDAHYLLAQQHFLEGDFNEARVAMDRAIALAAAPPTVAPPATLARYHYYRGRALDALDDRAAAAAAYASACEHDRGYAPPVLLLARRAAEVGDHRHAETLLIDAAREAIDQSGVVAAVPLQRGLARLLLANGDRSAAIEAYRGILAVTPDNAADRVALAEIYATEELPRAIAELRKVLDRDIHHAPAYRLSASYYLRVGAHERASRVLAALELLGFAEAGDRATAQRLREQHPPRPLVRTLSPELRYQLLATRAARDVIGEMWAAFAPEISARFSGTWLGENLLSLNAHGDHALAEDYAEVARIFEQRAEVLVGDRVPGLAFVSAHPRPVIVIDRSLLGESSPARRFLFGWALDALRGGYAVLLSLGAAQRRELTALMRALFLSEDERSGLAAELAASAGPAATKVLEKYAGRVRDLDVGGWIDGMLAGAKRSGLLACDEFGAAIWMIARLSGEVLASHDATHALGAVLGGPDLVRYYLSDDYQRLREALTTPLVPV